MKRKNNEQTLIESFKVVFPGEPVSSPVLHALEIQTLRDAYRRLAKKYHPDLSGGNSAHARTFAGIASAYEVLARFIVDRNKDSLKNALYTHTSTSHASNQSASGLSGAGGSWRFTHRSYDAGTAPKNDWSQAAGNSSASAETSSRRPASKSKAFVHNPPPDPGMKHEYFHTGEMPQKRMQIGSYLYHKGIISYQALVRALAWQRSCRPLFGELAKAWGFMTEAGISATLRSENSSGKFGDRAMDLGYLRKDQRSVVVLHQLSLQPAIGRYFVANRFVTERQLMQCLSEMSRHNNLYVSQ